MDSLKQLRKDVFQRSIDDNKLKEDALKKIDIVCGFDNDTVVKITFEDLKLFKVGENQNVNENVIFEKTYEDEIN